MIKHNRESFKYKIIFDKILVERWKLLVYIRCVIIIMGSIWYCYHHMRGCNEDLVFRILHTPLIIVNIVKSYYDVNDNIYIFFRYKDIPEYNNENNIIPDMRALNPAGVIFLSGWVTSLAWWENIALIVGMSWHHKYSFSPTVHRTSYMRTHKTRLPWKRILIIYYFKKK